MKNFDSGENFKILVKSLLYGSIIFTSAVIGAGLSYKVFGQHDSALLVALFGLVCLLITLNKVVWLKIANLDVKVQLILLIFILIIGINGKVVLGL